MTRPSGAAAAGLPVVVTAAHSVADPQRLADHFGEQCVIRYADLSSPELVRAATGGASAVMVGIQRLERAHIEAMAPDVRVIGRAGVGVDTIDLDTVASLGITLLNEPNYGAVEVASHAVGLMIGLQRKMPLADRFVRAGWRGALPLLPMKPFDELTVGLVGCGRIGAETARMVHPLAGAVLAHDPYATTIPPQVTPVGGLDELLRRSDVLSVHVPLTAQTRGLIGHRELSLLPAGAVVVNVSRGGIVDEPALADLLVKGHLGGAGLDVFTAEPLPATSPLLSAPNTILTPHCAAISDRAMWRLASWTLGDVLAWLSSGKVLHGSVVVAGSR